jgi:hypothetical protein
MVMNSPKIWKSREPFYRIYDTTVTGITYDVWLDIIDESYDNDKVFQINIPGISGIWHLARSFVKSHSG